MLSRALTPPVIVLLVAIAAVEFYDCILRKPAPIIDLWESQRRVVPCCFVAPGDLIQKSRCSYPGRRTRSRSMRSGIAHGVGVLVAATGLRAPARRDAAVWPQWA
jgi:hypothetical protein